MKVFLGILWIACVLAQALGADNPADAAATAADTGAATAEPFQCYVCDSLNNGTDCVGGTDGTLNKKYLMPCGEVEGVANAKYTLCRKIVTNVDFDVNENKATQRITRRCGYLSEEKYDTSCYYRAGFGGRQTVCSCKVSGCNGGATLSITYGLIGVLAVLGFLVGNKFVN